MAYSRPFGQQQTASPWSSGVPPGLHQPQQAQQPAAPTQAPAAQIFNQPMGPFDLSAAWQAQSQQAQVPPPQVATGQWAPQQMQPMQAPMQFVPNSGAFMQPMQMQLQPQRYHQQQQRFQNHQRSLSAPRIGGGQNNKRAGGNQNNSFGGGGQRQFNNSNSNNNNNNNNNQAQRTGRQQAKQGNQRVQFSNNNNINNNNSNNSNAKQQNQKQQQQQQQSKGPVKVTKAAKKQALANNLGPAKKDDKANNSVETGDKGAETGKANGEADKQQQPKPLSKTAERKQLKLQARKNAEALKLSTLPVVKSTKSAAEKQSDKDEPPIDQNQLKCVPAVFGFVCKVCDVFLRDRNARREHIDLEEHMQKYKVFEAELAAQKEPESEPPKEAEPPKETEPLKETEPPKEPEAPKESEAPKVESDSQ